MTPASTIRDALVALILLSSTGNALAQGGEAAPTPVAAPDSEPAPSSDEVIGDLPDDQQEAVEEAIEEAETPGGPPSSWCRRPTPTMREYDPSQETDQEAAAEERVRRDVPGDELHPKGEDELMGDHIVDRGDIKFRPGKGVEINSADDDFQLRIRVRAQFLFTVVERRGRTAGSRRAEETTNNFRIRRARFVFQGHAFGKHNQYKLEIDPLRKDNVVLDYYLDFTKKRDIQVRVGQYKISSNRQRVISSGNLQMVDRSIVNAEFTLDRDMSLDIRSRDFLGKNKMRYVFGISTGNGLNNPQFSDFSMVYLARLEYLPLGIFRDYSEVDFARTKPRLSIGATYSFFQGADACPWHDRRRFRRRGHGQLPLRLRRRDLQGPRLLGDQRVLLPRGLPQEHRRQHRTSGMRSLVRPRMHPRDPTAARNGLGWMLQAGYLVPNTRFELAGRGALIKANSKRRATSLTDRYGTTFSVSYYFARHPFKIQADVSQIWEDTFGEGATTLPSATPGLALS